MGWQQYLNQRVAKSVSGLFLLGEENNVVFVLELDVATGFENSVLLHTGGLESGKYVGLI